MVALVAPIQAATGQPGGDLEKQAAARAFFSEGLTHLEAERFEEAADRFERALALRPSPEIAYNLSSALIRLGRLLRASELLRQVVADGRASDKVREASRIRLDEVLPRLGQLTIHISGPSDRVTVRLDGEPVDPALLGVAFPVDPGRHEIVAVRGEGEPTERVVTVGEGGGVETTLTLAAPTPSVPRAPPAHAAGTLTQEPSPGAPPERQIGRSRWWLWTAIGILAAGAAATAAVAFQADPDVQPGRNGTIHVGGR